MPEIWRAIPGGPARYEVSSLGNIRGVYIRDGKRVTRRMKAHVNPKTGYLDITLSYADDPDSKPDLSTGRWWRKGKQRMHRMHQLVALAFLGPCPAGAEVNHINTIRSGCRAENLEYLTHSENMIHAKRIAKRRAGTLCACGRSKDSGQPQCPRCAAALNERRS